LIPVKILGNFVTGKVPTSITLEINYYQVTETHKEILQASLNFDQFVTPTPYQLSQTDVFEYKLHIVYKPMSHTEITIQFGFPWTVYLILYVGICAFASIIIAIFWLYNRIITRSNKVLKKNL